MKQIVAAFILFSVSSLGAITLVSVEQEIAVGRQANAQFRKETPELTDPAVLRYVRDVTDISRASPVVRSIPTASPSPTRTRSTPSHCPAVRSGFIAVCSSRPRMESQVVSVLAHEIRSHCEASCGNAVDDGRDDEVEPELPGVAALATPAVLAVRRSPLNFSRAVPH
jgi:hypothetical protein